MMSYVFRYVLGLGLGAIAAAGNGVIKEAVLDRAVKCMLRNKFLLGLFEDPYVASLEKTQRIVNSRDHRALARQAAEKGMILLKNENQTLPFRSADIRSFAVIGPNADEVHYGSYSAKTPGISILEGLRNFAQGRFTVSYAEGFKIYENDDSIPAGEKTREAVERRIREAVERGRRCDAILLVLGGNEKTCRESWFPDHFGDRSDLNLLGRQVDLARAILALGKPLAVSVEVINTGDRPGDEVVQLYLRDVISSVTRPVMELKGFRRITLTPGDIREVSFQITAEKLQFYNLDMQRVVEPGEFTVMVGPSSAEHLDATFRILK